MSLVLLVTSEFKVAISVVLIFILLVFDVMFAVLIAMFDVLVAILVSFAAILDVLLEILTVLEATLVGKLAIVDELTPPILFTVVGNNPVPLPLTSPVNVIN